jgi:hypothetical protein
MRRVDAANGSFVEALHIVNKRAQKLVCLANDVAGQNYLVTVTRWKKENTDHQKDTLDLGGVLYGAFWKTIHFSLRDATADQVVRWLHSSSG